MSKTVLAVGMSPVLPVPGDKERVFSPGRIKGYSCHSARQDAVCAEVRGVGVWVCVRVVLVTWNPEGCYLAFFCQGKDSNCISGFQKMPR